METMAKHALRHKKATGDWVGAVPQPRAAGDSHSNGRAEVSAQKVEDRVRFFKSELEHNIHAKIAAAHGRKAGQIGARR